jgi:hypothetical protein
VDAFFRSPLSTSAPNFEAKDIRVIANLIEGGEAALAYAGCIDCLAANNTIVNPAPWLIRILQENTGGGVYTFLPTENGRFINNLMYFDSSALSSYVNVGSNTNANAFQFITNLWYAHEDPTQSSPTAQAVMPSTARKRIVFCMTLSIVVIDTGPEPNFVI